MGIAKSIPATIAGSAIAAFGFSLGRDIYKGGKKNSDTVGLLLLIGIVLILIVIPAMGLYYGCLWIARNYRTPVAGFFWRIAGVGAALGSVVVGYIPHTILALLVAESFGYATEGDPVGLQILLKVDTYIEYIHNITVYGDHSINKFGAAPGWGPAFRWWLIFLLCSVGLYRGWRQRKRRQAAWEAQDHNVGFMYAIGLEEMPDGQYKDSWGNLYRIENRLNNMIEFFAVGRRNRRAYLEIDNAGRFVDWSGLTMKRA